jgi:hypothetical protein
MATGFDVIRRVRGRYTAESADDAPVPERRPDCTGTAMTPVSALDDAWRQRYAHGASWRAVYAARAHEALANLFEAMEQDEMPMPDSIEFRVDQRPQINTRSSEPLPDVLVFTARPADDRWSA